MGRIPPAQGSIFSKDQADGLSRSSLFMQSKRSLLFPMGSQM